MKIAFLYNGIHSKHNDIAITLIKSNFTLHAYMQIKRCHVEITAMAGEIFNWQT